MAGQKPSSPIKKSRKQKSLAPIVAQTKSATSSHHALTTASASTPSISFSWPGFQEQIPEPVQTNNVQTAFPPKIEAYMRKQSPMLLETYRLFQALDDQGIDDHKVPLTDTESLQATGEDD
jgi:hypothetical protein